ncbi:formin, FH2 domain-containing protein [Artemisia annua]|uniref:Formin, FH2 domain-containing protein n=1 Tax=Artemisia annua TaxID=35608 RepID=A0A2U1NIX5_ARTAN|nr:formin, FH2 domain-containing protein [Artemisia annua]
MDEKTQKFSILLRSIKSAFLLKREANNERLAPQPPPPPPCPLLGGVSPLPPVIRSVNGEGKNIDALIRYFGEDPRRLPYECGDAIGFRLESLLKLTDIRSNNHRTSLMHYLCKVLADKQPELLDFFKDLRSLVHASKLVVKSLADDMHSITTGLRNVKSERKYAKKDGPMSTRFRKVLRKFTPSAEIEVKSLMSLYYSVGKNIDALIRYFGEDPRRLPYECVVRTLLSFVQMFDKANKENAGQILAEKRKEEK